MGAMMSHAAMTMPRALGSEARRLVRSALLPVHLVCAIAAGLACGAYFSVAPWDPGMGVDAYVQFLGAMMPLMTGIVCGLALDEERRAGRLANLVAVPSRRIAISAKAAVLWIMGTGALALALGIFSAVLAAAGRLALEPSHLLAALGGLAVGSAPLYVLMVALSLRWGRNASIAVGAAGLVVAFFSVGGLAHGLMSGELTGAAPAGILGWIPFSWPARLGSLGIEAGIAAERGGASLPAIQGSYLTLAATALVVTAASAIALVIWFDRFEDGSSHD